MRKPKTSKAKRSHSDRKPRLLGFDYGVLQPIMAVGSFKFAQALTAADSLAIAFGIDTIPSLTSPVPSITLLARRREPLEEAFREFTAWAAASDGDAIELTIVFKQNGRYLFSLSPEPSTLTQRCLRFDRVYRTLPTFITWTKEQSATGPHIHLFRDYCKRLFSPFILHGATYSGLAVGPRPDPALLQTLDPSTKILKLSATFASDQDTEPGSLAWGLLRANRGERVPKGPAPEQMRMAESHAERRRILGTHFAVTLARLHDDARFRAAMAQLMGQGVQPWQVEQAACNLVVSRELTGTDHFTTLARGQLEARLVDALRNRFEPADETSLPDNINYDRLLMQVELDASELVRRVKLRAGHTLSAMLNALSAHGLLTPPLSQSR